MWNPTSLPDLSGRVFFITGGNTGIGYMIALHLAAKNARVYIGARSASKAEEAVANIKALHPKANVKIIIMDHTSLKSIKLGAEQFLSLESELHGLVMNAGISDRPYSLTEDGFEIQLQTNYISHWLLAHLLTPVLLSTSQRYGPGSARIVSVASDAHSLWGTKKMVYSDKEIQDAGDFGRYGLSKLANILHAKTLNAQLGPGSPSSKAKEGEIWVASLHPGLVDTQINQKTRGKAHWALRWIYPVLLFLGLMLPLERGCFSPLFVAASTEFNASMSGLYLGENSKPKTPSKAAMSLEERTKLEEWTVQELRKRDFLD